MHRFRPLLLAGLCWFALKTAPGQSIHAAQSAARLASLAQPSEQAAPLPAPTAPPTTLEAALHELFGQAAVTFTGEVISIVRGDDAVEVRWRVEDAVRGAQAGAVYTQREWPGLWESSDARYAVGQRSLVLLAAPSVAGYSSPIGAGDGVIPLRGAGLDSVLDLRLLATRVQATLPPVVRPRAFQIPAALAEVAQPTDVPAAATVDPNGSVDGGMVLAMLQSWQRAAATR